MYALKKSPTINYLYLCQKVSCTCCTRNGGSVLSPRALLAARPSASPAPRRRPAVANNTTTPTITQRCHQHWNNAISTADEYNNHATVLSSRSALPGTGLSNVPERRQHSPSQHDCKTAGADYLIEQLEELPYVVVPSLDLQRLLEVCEAQQAALGGVRICRQRRIPSNQSTKAQARAPSNHDSHVKAAARSF